MSSSTPFPLLSLPKELRLMAYERIPIEVRAHHLEGQCKDEAGETPTHAYTIIEKRIDLHILASCRQVREEAHVIVLKKVRDILYTPPRIIMDIMSAGFIHKACSPLAHLMQFMIAEGLQQEKPVRLPAQIQAEMIGRKGCSITNADHAVLAHHLGRWFAVFDQHKVSWRGQPVVPFMEIGITAPKEMTSEELLENTLLLVQRLILQGARQRFYLRSIEHMNTATNPTYRVVEKGYLDDVVQILRGAFGLESAETLQGPVIGKEEFDLEWTAAEYYYRSAH